MTYMDIIEEFTFIYELDLLEDSYFFWFESAERGEPKGPCIWFD